MSHSIGLSTHIAVANLDVSIVLLDPRTLTLGYHPDWIFQPKYFFPFAGKYMLAGKNSILNQNSGTDNGLNPFLKGFNEAIKQKNTEK